MKIVQAILMVKCNNKNLKELTLEFSKTTTAAITIRKIAKYYKIIKLKYLIGRLIMKLI